MSNILWICGYLVFLHMVHSYILLTANLEDFNAIAKQIAASPVAGQINKIFKRASSLFSHHTRNSPRLRATDDGESEEVEEDGQNKSSKTEVINDSETLEVPANDGQKEAEIIDNKPIKRMFEGQDNFMKQANNRNASFYLSSIRKIFENI